MATARADALRLGSRALGRAPAPLLVVAAAFSVQSGAALATTLFGALGPPGAVLLRTALGGLLLLGLAPRALRRPRAGPLRWALALGVTLAAMNTAFYSAIDRVPLGVAVTVEFLGPLAVAVGGSRRPRDLAWVVLAGAGVALLGSPTVDVDRVGLAFAFTAAACWALYIVVAKRLVASWPLASGLTASLLVASVVMAPLGVASAGWELLDLRLAAVGAAVALLASVVPYLLELAALRRLRVGAFGILMSLEPAVAALAGALFLSQRLGLLESLAVAFVVVASIGANRESSRSARGRARVSSGGEDGG